MSIQLIITGDNAPDFVAQFSSLAHALGMARGVMPEVAAAQPTLADGGQPVTETKPKATRTKAAPKAEETPAEPEPAVQEDKPIAEPKAPEPEVTESKVEETPTTEPDLDFNKDVAPKVTGYVLAHGKDFVTDILAQFGVTRASQLEKPSQWVELLAALSDADAKAAG